MSEPTEPQEIAKQLRLLASTECAPSAYIYRTMNRAADLLDVMRRLDFIARELDEYMAERMETRGEA